MRDRRSAPSTQTALELAVRAAKGRACQGRGAVRDRQSDGGTAADAHHHRRDYKADAGQRRAGARRRRSNGGARTGKSDEGDRAARLFADQGRLRRRGHRGRRGSRPGGVSRPNRGDDRKARIFAKPSSISARTFRLPLEVGLPFTVSLQLVPAVQVQGSIREIAPQADPVTRIAARPHCARAIRPTGFRLGATVTAKLDRGQAPALRVPASALLTKDGANFVWVVDQPANTVSLQKVDVVADPIGARVTGGLAPAPASSPPEIHSLKQGQQVRIEQDQKP